MDKSYFKTRKAEIQFEIDNWKQKMIRLEKEYISSNQKFPIGSKVCLTIPAHTVRILCDSKTKTIPEEKKFAYVTGYEIVSNEVVPILMKAKKDGTISKLREYIPFGQFTIELVE
jgi:hypothetical protein